MDVTHKVWLYFQHFRVVVPTLLATFRIVFVRTDGNQAFVTPLQNQTTVAAQTQRGTEAHVNAPAIAEAGVLGFHLLPVTAMEVPDDVCT